MKKVSVIMPTFNNGEKLHRTISSVLNQTMKSTDYELIIIDDHSNDNGETLNVIKKYKGLVRFKQLKKN
ncbi:glycosyltransferase, partial [Staphylococcus aureus]|nr:glycosyltransferase [Staphylococcus aureus]